MKIYYVAIEKKDGKKKYKGVVKSSSIEKNKMATKCLGITLTGKKVHIKLNELILK